MVETSPYGEVVSGSCHREKKIRISIEGRTRGCSRSTACNDDLLDMLRFVLCIVVWLGRLVFSCQLTAGRNAANASVMEASAPATADAQATLFPFRTDGPYLVALHILRDQSVLEQTFDPLLARTKQELTAGGMLRRAPEGLVLEPARRSRLRWLPTCE